MKISLTTKNNLVHSLLVIILISIIIFIAKTNSRYETYVELSGESANFSETIIEITPDNLSYNIVPGGQIKLQYQVSNFIDEKVNNNDDLQYYLELINSNPLLYSKIRETPEIEDYADFDSATSMNYVSEKGYGAISLLADGTNETKLFDIFLKCDENIDVDSLNLQIKLHAESKTTTDGSLDIDKIINLNLTFTNPENLDEPEEELEEEQEQEDIEPNEEQENQETNEQQENSNESQEDIENTEETENSNESQQNQEANEQQENSNESQQNQETNEQQENSNESQEEQQNSEESVNSNEATDNSESEENENTNEVMGNA